MKIANEKISNMYLDLVDTWNKLYDDITAFKKDNNIHILNIILDRALQKLKYAIYELDVVLAEVEIEREIQELRRK
jgi:hypothetical protein